MAVLKTAAFAGLLASSLVSPALIDQAQAQTPQARGEYLARAADCAACHTAPGGKPFAGGLGIATPLGTIVSTNITPSKTGGIGGYSLAQFSHAVRDGVRGDGANLYPAMPYTAYAGLTDADVEALYAYFTGAVQAVDQAPAPTVLPFPFNIRASMIGWNLLFLDKTRFQPDPKQSAEWNRGAYLVNTLAHCSTCHTPRNALMAEDGSKALSGASLGTWFAPNITPDVNSGIGSWTAGQLVAYLRNGDSGHGAQAAGSMLEAIDKSLSGLTGPDLQAIVTYLRSVPAVAGPEAAPPGSHGTPLSSDVALRAMPATTPDKMNGAQLYDAYCASCHRATGAGVPGPDGLPSLVGNTALGRGGADNAIMTVLDGVWPLRPEGQAMPAFASLLSDDQVALLTNYLFQQFGNRAIQTTAVHVASMRHGGEASPLIKIARIGMAVAGAIALFIVLVLLGVWRRRRGVHAA